VTPTKRSPPRTSKLAGHLGFISNTDGSDPDA
jgi:hypothetical protein